jgi:hypothetical protein
MTLTVEPPVSVWEGFKYSTPRDLSRRTDGGRIAKIATAIGKPGMPWQREVWDVATERDSAGHLVYEIVLVTVPRQSGKTTLYGPVTLDRVICNPGIKTFYTAQTGKDARSRFRDLVDLVKGSPLDAVARYRYSAGDEGITFPNGSSHKIFAPVQAALHGETPPLVGLDEIWEYDELLGDALLEGAIIPAQVTLFGQRQIWLMSTAGTAASTFMRKWVERGRAQAAAQRRGEAGPHPKLAYFEAALPEGADPYDPDIIARFHPAVGYTTTVEALLEISTQVSRATWLRAFCNVWLEAKDPLFSDEHLAKLYRDPVGTPFQDEIAVTYEIAPDNEAGIVMASWRDDDGRPCNRVLHAAPGTTWMHDLIVTIANDWRPRVLGADDGGPTRRLTDQLRRTLGEEAVVTMGGKDFGTACEGWLTMVRDEELVLDGSESFRHGFAHLTLKRISDVIRFSRTESTGPIVAPIAGAAGIWLYDHAEIVPESLTIHT